MGSLIADVIDGGGVVAEGAGLSSGGVGGLFAGGDWEVELVSETDSVEAAITRSPAEMCATDVVVETGAVQKPFTVDC